jgi:hypothetical protein
MTFGDNEHRELMATRVAAGKLIHAETAEITWRYACMFDPYSDNLDIPEELQIVGRERYVRSPGAGTSMWVHINDLPDTAREIILRRLSYSRS